MAETEAQRRAHKKYRAGQKNLSIAFKKEEQYLLNYISSQPVSKSDFVKKLIQKEYESNQ